MADEYVFPKSDGDVFYDGDVNLIQTILTNHIRRLVRPNKLNAGDDMDLSTAMKSVDRGISSFEPGTYSVGWIKQDNLVIEPFYDLSAATSTNWTSSGTDTLGTYYYNRSGNATYQSQNIYSIKDWQNITQTINSAFVFADMEVLNVQDKCNDSSVSGSWTTATTGTGSVSEDTTDLTINAGSGDAEAYWTGTDYRQSTKRVYFRVDLGGADLEIGVTNGTTDVVLLEHIAGSGSTLDGVLVELQFRGSEDKVDVYLDGCLIKSGVDLSSVTTNQYIRFYVDDGVINVIFLADDNVSSVSSTITVAVAADGSNFETVTNGTSHAFSNTGTTPVMKVTTTLNANEIILLHGWGIVRFS